MEIHGKFYEYKQSDYDSELKDCIQETCNYCIENTFANANEKLITQ